MIGQHVNAHGQNLAVLGCRQFGRHMIVASERRRRQILHPVLDPFHWDTENDRGDDGTDVAGINANLIAEAAADVGSDHMHFMFGNPRQDRDDGADDMREPGMCPTQSIHL